jgi:hypothetical protein
VEGCANVDRPWPRRRRAVAEGSDNETHGWKAAKKGQKIELKPKRVLKMCLGKKVGKKRKADRVFIESPSDWIGWSKAQVSWITT